MSQAQRRSYYAKKIDRAIVYLYGTPISKRALVVSVTILRLLEAGTQRGWLYPTEIRKLAKLIAAGKPVRKHATAL